MLYPGGGLLAQMFRFLPFIFLHAGIRNKIFAELQDPFKKPENNKFKLQFLYFVLKSTYRAFAFALTVSFLVSRKQIRCDPEGGRKVAV